MRKFEVEDARALERRRQACMDRLQEACAKAERYPLLSARYKEIVSSAYDQVLHWNDTEQFLACIDKDFNRFAYRIETCYLKRRSPNHAAARLCCLLLVDTLKIHAEILMDYRKDSYERMLSRLQQHTGNATEQDFRLALYRDVFLDTSHPTEPMAD